MFGTLGRPALAALLGLVVGGCPQPARPPDGQAAHAAAVVASAGASSAVARDASIGDHEMPRGKSATHAPGATSSWNEADPGLKNRFVAEFDATMKSGEDDRRVYAKYLPLLGVDALLDYLELQNPMCHGVAHSLGKELYSQTRDINGALQSCGSRCTGACMHGVVSEAFGSRLHEDVAHGMHAFCRDGEMARLHKPGNCAHAMGHALMLSSRGDLAQSLDACTRFERPGMDYYCATGVFMQYDMFLAEGALVLKRKSLYSPCDEHARFPAACYRYLMFEIGEQLGHDIGRMIDACLALAEPAQRRGCFHGLGNRHTRRIARQPELVGELCRHGGVEAQTMCIEGAVEKLADYDEQLGARACATLAGVSAQVCRAAVSHKMYSLDKPSLRLYRPQARDAAGNADGS